MWMRGRAERSVGGAEEAAQALRAKVTRSLLEVLAVEKWPTASGKLANSNWPRHVPRCFVQPRGCKSAVRSATLIMLHSLAGLAAEKWPAALKVPASGA